MKNVLTILIAIMLGLCVNGFENKDNDKVNEIVIREEKQITVEAESENIIAKDIENKTKEEQRTEEKNDTVCQTENGQQSIETPIVTEQNTKKNTQEKRKTQTKENEKKEEISQKSPKSIEKNLDSSTTFNIDDAGTAGWGHLTDADMEALGL